MTVRPPGNVTELGPGRWRARAYADGHLHSLGVHPLEEDAWDAIIGFWQRRKRSGGDDSFINIGRRVIEARELEGSTSVDSFALRFEKHVATAPWAVLPVQEIGTPDLVQWLRTDLYRRKADDRRRGGPRKIKRRTVQRIMSCVSSIFAEAVMLGKIDVNPCASIEVRLTAEEIADQEDAWDWMRPAEQKQFLACEAVPRWFRVMCWVAWRTGLRQGEQWSLTLDRVILSGPKPHLLVNRGSKRGATKTRKTRRVPLFGEGLDAMKEWLAILPTFAPENPHRLVFPRANGAHRGKGPPKLGLTDPVPGSARGRARKVLALEHYLQVAGIERHLRWHDLRHSFAANLVSGLWGRPRSLLEIKALLGHGSIKTTEIYAHLAEGFVDMAASEEGWTE